MARSIWSGFLSFGLVNVPVGLYPATADQTIHFNQLHKGTSHRIRYKKVDEVTGDEVKTEDIVNGFPLGGGEYVVVTRDELKEAAPGKSETIEISDFVDLGEIDPVHFRQTYYLAPRGKGADRAYALLRQAMDETGKIGIATMVLRDKEHLVAVRPGDDVLILETMYFADEIRSPSEELETLPKDASFQGRELDVAKRLVESLTVPWAPEDYRNTYRARVEELIEHKREGQAVVFEAERPKSNVIDLMAAGVELYLVDGLIGDAGAIVAAALPGRPGYQDVSTLREPYRLEGKKTIGYEIAEQLGWRLPDVIVYPAGGGVGIIGICKALRELRDLGWVAGTLPRLVAVQASGCAPIVAAFASGAAESQPWPDARTVAFGITVPKALGDFLVLGAVRGTGGTAIAVTDEALLADQRETARLRRQPASAPRGPRASRRSGSSASPAGWRPATRWSC